MQPAEVSHGEPPSAPFVMSFSTPTMMGSVLAAIAARGDLPPLSYVLHSSPNRVHVFWRVAGFTIEHVEALQKQLARELDTDPAATSCSQTTRLPGFLNQKRRPACRVTMEYRGVESMYTPGDFPTPSAVTPRGISTTRSCNPGMATRTCLNARAAISRRCRRPSPASTATCTRFACVVVWCGASRCADHDALTLLTDWNARCEPPWTERDLINKLVRARRYGREPIGGLLETPR